MSSSPSSSRLMAFRRSTRSAWARARGELEPITHVHVRYAGVAHTHSLESTPARQRASECRGRALAEPRPPPAHAPPLSCALRSARAQAYDEKNIRRRVYDALNVLMAMDIIAKEKKNITWRGLPTNARQEAERYAARALAPRASRRRDRGARQS